MLNRQDILSTLQSAMPVLGKKYSIKVLALFGSYSRNEANNESDIDIMVEFDKPVGVHFIDLADELEGLLHKKVDLVSRKGIKPAYMKAIEPELIYV
jgi:predicted nucleotidyltransferase